MSKFRIIGIRILEGCDHRIRKVLKEKKTYFFFDGQKYLDKLNHDSIWLAGHTHGVRQKDLKQEDGRIIHLKINPVGYPNEDSGNAAAMDNFIVEK